jgi:hypothetical protein
MKERQQTAGAPLRVGRQISGEQQLFWVDVY